MQQQQSQPMAKSFFNDARPDTPDAKIRVLTLNFTAGEAQALDHVEIQVDGKRVATVALQH